VRRGGKAAGLFSEEDGRAAEGYRIENLNKYLGTQVLVSEDVIGQLDTFLTRDLGRFRLAGKKKALGIHELVCRVEESDERQRELCATFSSILGTFRGRSWARGGKETSGDD